MWTISYWSFAMHLSMPMQLQYICFKKQSLSEESTSFFSKTRLAPNKPITIPRLELLAALIGTRCLKFVQKELKVNLSENMY